jgi:endoglucanase
MIGRNPPTEKDYLMKPVLFFILLFILTITACGPQRSADIQPTAVPQLATAAAPAEQAVTDAPQVVEEPAAPAQEAQPMQPTPTLHPDPAFAMNARLGRGVNLGNALEAAREGAWGVVIKEEFFPLIKEKGFQSVRVPIKWSARAQQSPPHTIDPKFFERIDWVVENALKNDLLVIINIHHFDEINADPQGNREFLLALWEQIAEHYKDAPETVLFELLNEPHGNRFTASVWNKMAEETLAVVRKSNPERFVIIGPVNWNSVDHLSSLRLPENDRRLIATFHYYNPFHFTHQGAEWNEGADQWLGTTWDATSRQQADVRSDMDKAVRWSEQYNRPIFMGEFGAYGKADMDSRARWTAFVAREAEARGFSWAYWEFCAGFGIYQADIKIWEQPLVNALIP